MCAFLPYRAPTANACFGSNLPVRRTRPARPAPCAFRPKAGWTHVDRGAKALAETIPVRTQIREATE
jgi:hypothetical protein